MLFGPVNISHFNFIYTVALKVKQKNKKVLAVAQLFGVMPVAGISNTNPANLSFQWKTFRTVWSFMYILCGFSVGTMTLRRLIKIGITAKNIGKMCNVFLIANFAYRRIKTLFSKLQLYSSQAVFSRTFCSYLWLNVGAS